MSLWIKRSSKFLYKHKTHLPHKHLLELHWSTQKTMTTQEGKKKTTTNYCDIIFFSMLNLFFWIKGKFSKEKLQLIFQQMEDCVFCIDVHVDLPTLRCCLFTAPSLPCCALTITFIEYHKCLKCFGIICQKYKFK